jgi:hypothetical protein
MKVHPRTIERRMVAGKIQSRKGDDGQVQVLITVPDTVEPVSSEAFETVKELANQQVDLAAGSASALVRVAQEQAMRAENQLLLARQDAGRYRRESQFAMATVGCILLLVIVAVGWCSHAITRASDNAAQSAQEAKMAQQALTAVRDQEETTAIARAKAEGELAAYKTELSGVVQLTNKHPATQPANVLQRMTQAFIGD